MFLVMYDTTGIILIFRHTSSSELNEMLEQEFGKFSTVPINILKTGYMFSYLGILSIQTVEDLMSSDAYIHVSRNN